ncbi:MAG TPA: threonine--tRNA ligase [Thermoanaerobaculia bacterium]|nr:threonine--tRNA ligase [Thermoanaerobaculia bacterium]
MEHQRTDDDIYRLRHSTAHVLANAVLDLFPHAKVAIGPPITDGFYYDFDLGKDENGGNKTFTPEDLERLEARMREIIGENNAFQYREVSLDDAQKLFAQQPYKLELIDGIAKGGVNEYGEESDEKPVISTFTEGHFEDLCRGPHVERTGLINPEAIKLLNVSGAYWRGNEKNPMLQRIYGTVWKTKKELDEHLHRLEEAKKRDHRKLGRELDIYTFDEEVGPGLPLWLPNGGILIEEIERLAKERELGAGYLRVRTPNVTKENLFIRSGHLPYYAESMYPPMELEGQKYYVKPMNCPFHHKIFAARPRSYRDLPMRLAEYGTCYRYERSGDLFGLMRVRLLEMNDAHIYCTEEQFESEFLAVVRMYQDYFNLFGIEKYVMRLSTHHSRGLGKKYVDNERLWVETEDMVRRAMRSGEVPFVEEKDEAAFYGPKIDVQVWSAIGKEFTLATNQVDFAVTERFNLTYVTSEGKHATPLCIHRAPLSTHERMIGFLIEHYAGNFPVWLAPRQVLIIPISDSHHEYARKLNASLVATGIRSEADFSAERMNAKVREGQLKKIPYMLVLGDREVANQTVSLRKRDGSKENDLSFEAFAALIRTRIDTRSPEL